MSTLKPLLNLVLAGCLLCTVVVSAAERSGGWRLAHESSPYLQLHAGNPVEWHPWGAPALEKARRENKPLFISIGYFTCHWCHVMEEESFSNDAIAKLLNEHFIAIKIDREQRPDLDDAYMEYVMLTTGRGGWPMSVWATPDGAPFLGGTYYPPESGPRGTGFRELLERIVALWQEDEATIRSAAQEAVQLLAGRDSQTAAARIDDTPLAAARREYGDTYDALQGGFGPAPKFPQPARLLFLLDDSDESSHAMALYTLERMIAGGIHDQLGGGFHRYAVDFEWHLPHFEKMLYDQALIARACLAAWRRTQRPLFADAVRSTLDFALRDMRHPQGGFYSALGADSPSGTGEDARMIEGAYYTWDWQQLVDALGEDELLEWAVARYGLLQRGNALHDPLGEMDGRNVLQLVLDDQQLADRFGVDLPTVRQRNARVAERLRMARDARP
ncbi:MAG: DUF255 domain-containing protein, partial [Thiohalobacterales bacterium]|nr:DUF255 domain-containing protein [Thiohalobacterales bacterium]